MEEFLRRTEKISLPFSRSLIMLETPFQNSEKFVTPVILLHTSCIHVYLSREEATVCMTGVGHKTTGLEGGKSENEAKAAKQKAIYLLDNSCSAFHMVCCNGEELSQESEKGDFGIVVMKEYSIEGS